MKKTVILLLTLLVLLSLFVCHAAAEEITYSGTWGDLSWTLDSNGLLTITGTGGMNDFPYESSDAWRRYRSTIRSVEIREGVTSIGEKAFYECSSLETIILPAGLVSIGKRALGLCTSLKSIELPEGLREIGDDSFLRCESLERISIPDSVVTIGNQTFFNCISLREASLPGSLKAIPERMFEFCESLTEITIPEGIRWIGANAFFRCSGLRSITIPDGVTAIQLAAFQNCTNLKTVILPESLKSIGYYAFYECESLESVVIPGSVGKIEDFAFGKCTHLKEIVVSSANNKFSSIDGVLFSGNRKRIIAYPAGKGDKSYTVPDGVTSIPSYAFYHCDTLEELVIPASVTRFENNAVYYCEQLKVIRYLGKPKTQEKFMTYENKKELKDVTWYYEMPATPEINAVESSDAEVAPEPVQLTDIPVFTDLYTEKKAELRKAGGNERTTLYSGPGKEYVANRKINSRERNTTTACFIENDMVFIHFVHRSVDNYAYVTRKAMLGSLTDLPVISELPYVQKKITKATVTFAGPGEKYEWPGPAVPANATVKCFFTIDGYCFVEFETGMGPARAWIESGLIVSE